MGWMHFRVRSHLKSWPSGELSTKHISTGSTLQGWTIWMCTVSLTTVSSTYKWQNYDNVSRIWKKLFFSTKKTYVFLSSVFHATHHGNWILVVGRRNMIIWSPPPPSSTQQIGSVCKWKSREESILPPPPNTLWGAMCSALRLFVRGTVSCVAFLSVRNYH
jgi:hypothetical protein